MSERRWQLSDLLDLECELERDRRNGGTSVSVDNPQAPAGELLYTWMSARRDPAAPSLGDRFHASEQLLLWIGIVLSSLLGVGLTAGLLRYSGEALINVMAFLAVAVGMQLLALLVSAVALLTSHFRPRAGEWLLRLTRIDLLSRQLALSFPLIRLRAFGLLQAWAVGLNLGILLTLLFKVVFFDLSFGWATTLDVTTNQIQGLLSGLSLPWRGILPSAVPGLEDVEQSRIVLASGVAATGAASWWQFLFAAVLVYGLLPRLLLLTASMLLVRFALSRLKFETAACQSLLLRLRQHIGPGANRAESASTPVPVAGSTQTAPPGSYQLRLPTGWSAPVDKERLRSGFAVDAIAEDAQSRLLRLVEAWRPPLEQDLVELRDLLDSLPRDAVILLGMLGLGNGEELVAPDDQDLAIWSEFVRRRVSDTRIAVVAFREAGA